MSAEVNELNEIIHNINPSQRISSKLGLYLIGITGNITKIVTSINVIHSYNFFSGGIATAISVICIPFVSPAFRKVCLPYVPATSQQVKNVLQALEGRTGSLIDLGSGDGRIVNISLL